jgi:hypothetical protein
MEMPAHRLNWRFGKLVCNVATWQVEHRQVRCGMPNCDEEAAERVGREIESVQTAEAALQRG